MSVKTALKQTLGNSVLWRAVSSVKRTIGFAKNVAYVSAQFLLGRCSFDKLKAFVLEYNTRGRIMSARAKGIDIVPKTYNGKRIFTVDEANEFIGDAIAKGEPFMAGRFGSTELASIWIVREDGKGFMYPMKKALNSLYIYSGFFPKDENMLIKFAMLMRQATHEVDIMAIWWNHMEQWMLRTYGSNPEYCALHSLDPFVSSVPWSAKLEGKRVVVIHPFADTIRSQYAKHELLFPDRNVLPEFHLRTVKAVQTLVGNRDERFVTWFDALEYMYNEAMSEDFDVAIIGCGAYGFPLAAKIKQAGKTAIHLGGVTQLLFGIRGRRWEVEYKGAYPEMMKNPAWVYPAEAERPKGFETIEGGCYW